MSSSLPPWMEKIGLDKKKLCLMACLLAVAMLLWGRLLLKQVPRTATATENNAAADASGSNDGNDQAAQAVHKVVYVDLPRTLERDLFALNDDGYEVLPDKLPKVAKLDEQPDDVPSEPGYPITNLELQAVIRGHRPVAMINNKMYRPGQDIEGYTLVEVGDREAILKRGGTRYTLKLNVDLEF